MAAAGPAETECSHGVTLSPIASSLVVLILVALKNVSDLGHEGIIGVGVSEQGADGKENLRDGEGGRPLVLQDVQADGAIAVDVHMINLCREGDLGWLEGIVGREMDVEEEDTLMIRRVLGAHNSSLPMELVRFVGGAGGAVCGRISAKINELLLDSF